MTQYSNQMFVNPRTKQKQFITPEMTRRVYAVKKAVESGSFKTKAVRSIAKMDNTYFDAIAAGLGVSVKALSAHERLAIARKAIKRPTREYTPRQPRATRGASHTVEYQNGRFNLLLTGLTPLQMAKALKAAGIR